ncbi:hypothetical protein Desku_2407 [Desulfofundulus kuznetsovii DSM 6115]|uniref:Uncharacterized protein n=1 Tax=Desulfofundulus kuznetsovii (strain DSM 6115 / VKM B-1805 / 17) TaxID=760568 RepID=A0AAU8PUV2_DESK7|nr:hypothetical protein Desku_2407 [Desulfofundulus kuznetsovii DSM 6115]
MESVKIVYGIKNEFLKKRRRKLLSPIEKLKAKKEMAAVMKLAGLWEDKDTSFFDKR